MTTAPALSAVLFDLDGTLIDSAPDLAGAANDMRQARGLLPIAYERLRPMVGSGARGMVNVAFGVAPPAPVFASLRDEFLQCYEQRMTRDTRIFDHVPPLLDTLEARGLRWGIVTNKAVRFAEPLVRSLGLHERTAVLVCGDTTPHAKPHPAPLLEAALRLGVLPSACVYVGDDLRDVQAGRAAGMVTMAVTWGYLGVGDSIDAWGADLVVSTAAELLNAITALKAGSLA